MTGHLIVPQDSNESYERLTQLYIGLVQVYEAQVCRCVVLYCSINKLYCHPDLISRSVTLTEPYCDSNSCGYIMACNLLWRIRDNTFPAMAK